MLQVPRIDPQQHHLQIELSDGEEMSYSLDDLKQKFQQHTVTVTLQVSGDQWVARTSLQWRVASLSTQRLTSW